MAANQMTWMKPKDSGSNLQSNNRDRKRFHQSLQPKTVINANMLKQLVLKKYNPQQNTTRKT